MSFSLDVVRIIRDKRDGLEINDRDMQQLIKGYVSGLVPDYQMSALAMAIYYQGMTISEIVNLTYALADSGHKINFSGLPSVIVDKHSTGGIGDTTTPILIPLVAGAGLTVAKLSGRGLGYTGGTIDKLYAVPGISLEMDLANFEKQIRDIGIGIMAATDKLAPADKMLYALRDVTSTVESLPLIASSVMSKKLVINSEAIVLDVKVGRGSFISSEAEAVKLAEIMVKIGQRVGRKVVALITNMDFPLGSAIGNALSMQEVFSIIQGGGDKTPLKELSLILGGYMLSLGGLVEDPRLGIEKLEQLILSGKAMDFCRKWISSQGGDVRVLTDFSLLPQARFQETFYAMQTGVIKGIDALVIGQASLCLGAGRQRKEDAIDLAAGVMLHVKPGEQVFRGTKLATLYTNNESAIITSLRMVNEAFSWLENGETFKERPLVHRVIS